MSIRDICETVVVTTPKDTSVYEAAQLMKKQNVGNVVVVDKQNSSKPVGIITDRDVVMKIVADDGDAKKVTVGDAMTENLLVLKSNQGLNEALNMMGAKGVRRAPIVDENNSIVGIATVDDLLILIAKEVNKLAYLISKQVASVKQEMTKENLFCG
jgi:CBS domain-containing protein